MKNLFMIIQNFIPKTLPKPLGRWNNDCHLKTNKKIDFANEDHCGPCGSLLKDKMIETIKDKIIKDKSF